MKTLEFCQNFLNISIVVTIFKKSQFWSKFSNNSVFAKIVDFVNILEKSRFWSHYSEISIKVRVHEKISILAKIVENLDFREKLQKSRF